MTPSCESFASVFVLLLIWGFKWGVVFPLDEMIPLDIVLPFFFFFWEKDKPIAFFWPFLMYVCIYINLSFNFIFFQNLWKSVNAAAWVHPPWFGRCVTPPRLEDIACVIYSGERRDTELDYMIWELFSLDYVYALKHLWSTKYKGKMESLSWWDTGKD